jgi:hypothetical protein
MQALVAQNNRLLRNHPFCFGKPNLASTFPASVISTRGEIFRTKTRFAQ